MNEKLEARKKELETEIRNKSEYVSKLNDALIENNKGLLMLQGALAITNEYLEKEKPENSKPVKNEKVTNK